MSQLVTQQSVEVGDAPNDTVLDDDITIDGGHKILSATLVAGVRVDQAHADGPRIRDPFGAVVVENDGVDAVVAVRCSDCCRSCHAGYDTGARLVDPCGNPSVGRPESVGLTCL